MTSDIWLVRHAATSWTGIRWCGRSDPPLTPEGAAQAARLAEHLRSVSGPGATLVASPARRAFESAKAIAALSEPRASTAIATDGDLAEIDFGQVDGLTFEDIDARWPTLATRLANGETWIDWPGGETAEQVRKRAKRAWSTLADAVARSTVVAVTHGGLIAVILREVLGERDPAAAHPAPATAVRLRKVEGSWVVQGRAAATKPGAEMPIADPAPV